MAEDNLWHGYRRIALICRRDKLKARNRQLFNVMKDHDLLRKNRPRRDAALHQTAKLYELPPTGLNDLWQTEVTSIHVPGHGRWYAVMVIDDHSRYLLAMRFS